MRSAPIILLQLDQDLMSFSFTSQTADDLKTGIQPYVVIDRLEEY